MPKGDAQLTTVSRLLSSGLNINSLRTNNLLRYDEWKALDEAVVQVTRERLVTVDDLIDRGLTRDLGGLGVLIDQYEKQSDMTGAEVNMSGVTAGEEDTVSFDIAGVPIPIIHKDFRLNIRHLEASRRLGSSLDMTNAEVAARKVSEKLEDLVLNGSDVQIDGRKIEGYTSHPQRITGSLDDWDSIDNIYSNVKDMISDAEDDGFYGPFVLYVATEEAGDMRQVYTDGSGQTARSRIEENLDQIEEIRTADKLPNGEAVLVQMTRDVVTLSIGAEITPVEWETRGGMEMHFKIMAAMAPIVKSDYNNNCGVVHYD